VSTAVLADLLIGQRSGYWGGEPGTSDRDVLVVRNGDVGEGTVRWSSVPIRGMPAKEAARAQVRIGDILLTTSGYCGDVGLVDEKAPNTAVVSNFVRLLRPNPDVVHPSYLFRFMRRASFRARLKPFIRGTAMKNLAVADALRAITIPLPSLPEQRRISDVLYRAETLRQKREKSLGLLDDLTQSVFLEMFVRKASSSWSTISVGEAVDQHQGGMRTGPFGSQLLHSEFVDSGVAVLGIDNAVSNTFTWGRRRYISQAKYRELTRYTVHSGDVIITIMGTCGRCAIVPVDIPLAINTKHLCCVTLDQRKCLPGFLHSYFLVHPASRNYLQREAKGAIMSGLNMGIIRELPLVLPPLELQEEFVRGTAAIDRLKTKEHDQLVEMDALVSSLEQRAFACERDGSRVRP
jgi:type I restriction enzyme S subunit